MDMATNDGSGNGVSNSQAEENIRKANQNYQPKTISHPGSISRVIMMTFSYLVLLAGFFLSIKYMSDIAAINRLNNFDQQKLKEVKNLYIFYAWVYPISAVITFSVLNVLNAIYLKLYK